jgi:hypothetical protein
VCLWDTAVGKVLGGLLDMCFRYVLNQTCWDELVLQVEPEYNCTCSRVLSSNELVVMFASLLRMSRKESKMEKGTRKMERRMLCMYCIIFMFCTS